MAKRQNTTDQGQENVSCQGSGTIAVQDQENHSNRLYFKLACETNNGPEIDFDNANIGHFNFDMSIFLEPRLITFLELIRGPKFKQIYKVYIEIMLYNTYHTTQIRLATYQGQTERMGTSVFIHLLKSRYICTETLLFT